MSAPFTAYNLDTVRRAELSAGPTRAADGGSLAGALDLDGRAEPSERASGFVDFSLLGVGALVRAPLGDKFSVSVAGRHSPPARIYAIDDVYCWPDAYPRPQKTFFTQRYCWVVWTPGHRGPARFWWLSAQDFHAAPSR